MKQVIESSKGLLFFKPKYLYQGRKKIDKKIARTNLLTTRNILKKSKIRWGLIFGTLLGAFREKDFITHDDDVDIFVYYEDKKILIDLLHEFKNYGFEIVRFEKDSLLSIMRKNEQTDFYLFKKTLLGRRCLNYYIPKIYFKRIGKIKFFNKYFPTIDRINQYLIFQYGKKWKVPKKNAHANSNIQWKNILKRIIPNVILTLVLLKKKS
jgi:lipopolysaccharide cholinephosphotransferase